MEKPQKSSLSRSSSRSRRSQINLSDLRLSPLSTRFADTPKDSSVMADDAPDPSFTRSHSSYLQGRSAPTSPGILSRSSSRRNLGAGLSRKGSLYDNDSPAGAEYDRYDYAGVVRGEDGSARVEVGSGQIPKAKSEAALLVQRSKGGTQSMQSKKQRMYQARSRTGGTNTPRTKNRPKSVEDDWFTRTGAATNALLQETKGQSWLASRESLTSLTALQDTSDEDEDEGYEELAAQSAASSRRQLIDDELSPVNTRSGRWGSRYGSRTASRRTSRRGSMTLTTGSRTPLATQQSGQEGFFDDIPDTMSMEPDFVDADEENESQDEASLSRLAESRSFGIGGIVDRIMNLSLFKVEEREEVTEDEDLHAGESAEQARERREAENRRKREEKERLVLRQREGGEVEGKGEGGWADAAWLFSTAAKAIL